jgi:hypothetical protein
MAHFNQRTTVLYKSKPAGEALRNTTVLASRASIILRFGIRAKQALNKLAIPLRGQPGISPSSQTFILEAKSI